MTTPAGIGGTGGRCCVEGTAQPLGRRVIAQPSNDPGAPHRASPAGGQPEFPRPGSASCGSGRGARPRNGRDARPTSPAAPLCPPGVSTGQRDEWQSNLPDDHRRRPDGADADRRTLGVRSPHHRRGAARGDGVSVVTPCRARRPPGDDRPHRRRQIALPSRSAPRSGDLRRGGRCHPCAPHP